MHQDLSFYYFFFLFLSMIGIDFMVLFFLRCPNAISIIGTMCLPLSDLIIKDPIVKKC